MRIEEIKETKVVGNRYFAEDGTMFYDREECLKYEKSALFVTRSKLKLIAVTDEEELAIIGCGDNAVEIFDIQTPEDLDNLEAYVHLVISTRGVRNMDSYFGDSEFGFGGITLGHEVIVWWSYDKDCFWIYGDGSIDAYVDVIRNRALKVIEKNQPKKEEGNEETD